MADKIRLSQLEDAEDAFAAAKESGDAAAIQEAATVFEDLRSAWRQQEVDAGRRAEGPAAGAATVEP